MRKMLLSALFTLVLLAVSIAPTFADSIGPTP